MMFHELHARALIDMESGVAATDMAAGAVLCNRCGVFDSASSSGSEVEVLIEAASLIHILISEQ